MCFFPNLLQPIPLHVRDQLIWSEIWVYSHPYRLAIFCTTNSSTVLARERSQNIENSWKKTQWTSCILNNSKRAGDFVTKAVRKGTDSITTAWGWLNWRCSAINFAQVFRREASSKYYFIRLVDVLTTVGLLCFSDTSLIPYYFTTW